MADQVIVAAQKPVEAVVEPLIESVRWTGVGPCQDNRELYSGTTVIATK